MFEIDILSSTYKLNKKLKMTSNNKKDQVIWCRNIEFLLSYPPLLHLHAKFSQIQKTIQCFMYKYTDLKIRMNKKCTV